jgi:lipid-binding SYLF domain-containing protein
VKLMMATTVATTLALTPLLAADSEPAKRLDAAAAVFSEVMTAPDKSIPQELLGRAHCIVIVPDLKTAAFGIGGKYGKDTSPVESRANQGGLPPARSASKGGVWASRSAVLRPT